MEIYKDLSSPVSQQFEKLLNNQLSKNKIEEGKIIEGKITKITDKYVKLTSVLDEIINMFWDDDNKRFTLAQLEDISVEKWNMKSDKYKSKHEFETTRGRVILDYVKNLEAQIRAVKRYKNLFKRSDEKIGKGRKLADPDPKVLVPIMQSIFDRRFANSVEAMDVLFHAVMILPTLPLQHVIV